MKEPFVPGYLLILIKWSVQVCGKQLMQTCVPVVEPTVGGKGCPAPLSSLFLQVTCKGLVFPALWERKEAQPHSHTGCPGVRGQLGTDLGGGSGSVSPDSR